MKAELTERRALVTGGTSGIGEAIALWLAREGAEVVVVGRRSQKLAEMAAKGQEEGQRIVPHMCDLADRHQLEQLVPAVEATYGGVDILVNSAGCAESLAKVHDLNLDSWRKDIELNLTAPATLCAQTLPGMRTRRWGRIVNIASEAGSEIATGMGGYCVSKHGLRVLTELIQSECQELGIRAWALCPGEVDTEMSDRVHGNVDRFLKVGDIVDLVAFLFAQRDDVKYGPAVLIRTTFDPFEGSNRSKDKSL